MTKIKGQLRNIVDFLTPRIVGLFGVGVGIGLLLSVVELGFAYGLQGFLVALGMMDPGLIKLPAWLPQLTLTNVVITLLTFGVLRALCNWAQIANQGFTHEETKYLIRKRLLTSAFNSESVSGSKITGFFNEKTNNVGSTLVCFHGATVKLTTSIFLGLSLLWLSPITTLFVGVTMGGLSLVTHQINRRVKEAGKVLKLDWDQTNRRLMNSIKNLLLIRIYGTQKLEETRAQLTLQSYLQHLLRFYNLSGIKYALPQVLGVVLICLLALASRFTWGPQPAILMTYLYILVRFIQGFSETGRFTSLAVLHWPQVKEIYAWWLEQPRNALSSLDQPATPPVRGNLSTGPLGWKIQNVSFRYPGAPQDLLNQFSLRVKPGEALVITGPSGAGKSTLINLLLGITHPGAGSILLEDETGKLWPLNDEARLELLPRVGYVGPEGFLIEGSVYENITYGLGHTPTPEELDLAIQSSECQFIYQMPNGIKHMLTDQGQGLSSGQKQRLGMLRALLRNPAVLILDEATSNLDSETEHRVIEQLRQMKSNCTLMIVSHRESLLSLADQHIKLEASPHFEFETGLTSQAPETPTFEATLA